MRQDELKQEGDKCHHGLYFGSNCEYCDKEFVTWCKALELAARIAEDNCNGAVCCTLPARIRALKRP